ncbi:hypothetical protein GCM10009804_36690 [Kribbella hippodromi]|uniref:Transcriptional regulator n=1 Tax=Kribbella hippodromi TaxID=434347 RepID=A0ABN2DJN8_9ACTN
MSEVGSGAVGIAERRIGATDWGRYERLSGSAAGLGEVLLSLLDADREGAGAARDHLENEVVPQANLYGAAEPVITVSAASLADPRPQWVRIVVLDLMFVILSGAPTLEEVERGNGALLEHCVARVRESAWLIAREALTDVACYDAALDVLDIADADKKVSEFIRLAGQGKP